MATTGFWPVKDRLKEVIDYAENPDKTIDKKYVDSDLYAALRYVSNDKKTDERMYVSGINCNAKRAYERMTATKKTLRENGRQCGIPRLPEFPDRRSHARRSAQNRTGNRKAYVGKQV